VYKGLRPPVGPWVYNHTCFSSALIAPPAIDPTVPPLGGSFYYLVSRENACGESVIGRKSDGTPIPNPFPCP